ncbi:hypothetical protein [Flavobacterium sp. TBRC 19031]|uniref:hypothetical protein n=1 Tax=Flavobacterium mekongense TaxID=3379707 RepID=UPI00399AD46D
MKTNFYKSLKLVLFLLFTALSSSIVVAETMPPKAEISPIGGSRSPWPDFSYVLHDVNTIALANVNDNVLPDGSYHQRVMSEVSTLYDVSFIAVGGKSTPKPILFESVLATSADEWEIRVINLPQYDFAFQLSDLQLEESIKGLLFST